ncbi:hypothetical protein DSO57_1025251 [Entomophthora muscae]|uniref:Uncharacterized protein n=1 Tax=Entomophthora muscae TaxID=34485 RepID=A0ACC2U0V8_9FUNG|nr:hypothetical protein DSO57_1025251 [Entomophthora muscae]
MPYRAIFRMIHYDGTATTHSLLLGPQEGGIRKRADHFKLLKPSTWCRSKMRRNSFDAAIIKKEAIVKDSREMDASVDWADMMEWPLDSFQTVTLRDGSRHITCAYDDPPARERIKALVKGTSFDDLLHGGYDPAPGASRCQTIHLTLTPEHLQVPLSP